MSIGYAAGDTYALRKAREAREVGDEKKAEYWEHIEATVAAMPPLTDDEIVTLRAIFTSPCGSRATA